MTRLTKSNIEGVFRRLIRMIDGRVAEAYNDVGAYRLDYNQYGGYRIEQIISEGGGVSTPFGFYRRKAREFWNACQFMINGIYHLEDLGIIR